MLTPRDDGLASLHPTPPVMYEAAFLSFDSSVISLEWHAPSLSNNFLHKQDLPTNKQDQKKYVNLQTLNRKVFIKF